MKLTRRNYVFGIIALLTITLICLVACSSSSDDHIPITTSSDEALEQFKLGRDLTERLRNPDALRHFQRAVKADPEFAIAYLYLAGAHPSPKGFFENLDLAHEHSEGISKGEQLLIDATQAGVGGDPARQLEICKELVALYPLDARARMLLANQYFGVQDYTIAVTQYEAVIALDVAYAPPYNMLGYSQRFLNNYEEAGKAFKRYIELIPDDPNPYDSYAELLSRMGKFEEAIDHYRMALETDHTFGASRLGIATNLVFLDRHTEARAELAEYFGEAINSGQQRAALFAAAVSFTDEGDYEQALKMLQQRYDLDAEISDTAAMAGGLGNIAFLQLRSHQPGQARKNTDRQLALIEGSSLFDRVKTIARQNEIAFGALLELERGNLAKAREAGNEYLTVTEATRNVMRVRAAHQVLGRIALAQEEFDTAIAHLEQADQQTAFSRFYLASAYEGKGDTDQAAKLYELAATTYELNSLTYASIRREASERAEALKH